MYCSDEKFKYLSSRLEYIKSIRSLYENTKFSLALKSINEFLTKYGEDVEILYIYGKILRKIGDANKSIDTFKKALSILEISNREDFSSSISTELFKTYYINDYYKEAYDLLNSGNVDLYFTTNFNSNLPDADLLKKY